MQNKNAANGEETKIEVIMSSTAKGYMANGIFDGKGITVLKGSVVCMYVSDSVRNTDKQFELRRTYLDENRKTIRDLYFETPSAASNFVCGRSSSGWHEWKTTDGVKLSECRDIVNSYHDGSSDTVIESKNNIDKKPAKSALDEVISNNKDAKKMLIENTNSEKEALAEERINLKKIESKLDHSIEEEKDRLNKKKSEKKGIFAKDRDGKAYMDEINEYITLLNNNITEYESCKDSPYFGRMDLIDTEGNDGKYFIGEKGININGDQIVVDWRTPFGSTFYNKSETEYDIEDREYKLLLRRAINIKNAKVLSVNTEYDETNLSFEGEVIDSFLLSVLQDKRRNYKLTDIIKSIQKNQNELIRQPIEDNFIVQGCAGSGKTMIMLHRLSYIAFNYPNINFSRFYLITPNDNFNLQIDELSKKLELDKINRYTVDSYYAYWIRLLAGRDQSRETIKNTLKIGSVYDVTDSEKQLNFEMLSEFYSEDFFNRFINHFESDISNTFNGLKLLGIPEILISHGKNVNLDKDNVFNTFETLKTTVSSMIYYHKKNNQSLITKKDEYASVCDEIKTVVQNKDNRYSELATEKENVISCLSDKNRQTNESISDLNDALIWENNKTENDKERIKEIEETIKKIQLAKEAASVPKDKLLDPEYIESSKTELAVKIKNECGDEISRILLNRSEYERIPAYNFNKRRKIKQAIEIDKMTFTEKTEKIIESYKLQFAGNDEIALKKELDSLKDGITKRNKSVDHIKNEIAEKRHITDTIGRCLSVMQNNVAFPDVDKELSPSDIQELFRTISQYRTLYKLYLDAVNRVKQIEARGNRISQEISELEKTVLDKDELSKIEEANTKIDHLDMETLMSEYEELICSVYIKHKQKYKKTAKYRHLQFYKLLLCSIYYGNPYKRNYCLSIDEAQDLAKIEIMLIRRLTGNTAVFNLYGDVNQVVYDYKGIADWEDVGTEVPGRIFVLNENYRNTIQITDFCNKEFGAEITGVGLPGDEVEELPFDDALAKIETLKRSNSEARAAIIYRKGVDEVQNVIIGSGLDIISGAADNSKIMLMTVEEAKGLEFEYVLVVKNCMTDTELYISYTRALDNLITTEIDSGTIRFDEPDDTYDGVEIANADYSSEHKTHTINMSSVSTAKKSYAKQAYKNEKMLNALAENLKTKYPSGTLPRTVSQFAVENGIVPYELRKTISETYDGMTLAEFLEKQGFHDIPLSYNTYSKGNK